LGNFWRRFGGALDGDVLWDQRYLMSGMAFIECGVIDVVGV